MAFLFKGFHFGYRKLLKPFLVRRVVVDGNPGHVGEDHQEVGLHRGGEPFAGEVLVDDRSTPW